MGGLERRLVALVVSLGALTAVSVLVADLATPEAPAESLASASLPPESRSQPANETVEPPTCSPRGCTPPTPSR